MGEHLTKHVRKFAHGKGRPGAREILYELEADAMKALAHPKRLLVLDLLSDGKERNVGQLVEDTDMSQTNLSQNLAVLRTAGLVAARRDGNLVYYRVTDQRVVRAVGLVRAVMAEQAEDGQFLRERTAQKQKERVRKATMGAYFVLGVVGLLALFALTHPLLVGGSLSDMGEHAQLMIASGSFSNFWETCLNVGPETPAGAAMPPMAA